MIYFDNAATTAPFKEALTVFTKINETDFANPSANHYFGEKALQILEEARASVLVSLKLEKTHRCLFCSGASESDNLAIKGVAFHYANRGKKIITDAVEHPAVLNTVKQLEKDFGYTVVVLPVRSDGTVDPAVLAEAMDDQTILVSIMAVNNEIGSINDINALAAVVHQHPKAFFHVDATQAMGKVDLDYSPADLISFSGHKFGATKGTGCLLYRKNLAFQSLVSGGEQEYGFRAGTDNVAGDAALATALMLSYQRISQNEHYVEVLRDHLVNELSKRIGIVINSPENGSPYVVNFSLVHKKASVVMEALSRKEIYVSTVSACNSKFEKTSYVLQAIGKNDALASNGIRISFSARNTLEEVDAFLAALDEILQEVHDR
jgi:cysteine desulfurase